MVCCLEDLKTPKFLSEINWPLEFHNRCWNYFVKQEWLRNVLVPLYPLSLQKRLHTGASHNSTANLQSLFSCCLGLCHGLRTPREEIAFTALPKIQSQSQIFIYGRSIFCLPHRAKFSDFFDLCLHRVSIVRAHSPTKNWRNWDEN